MLGLIAGITLATILTLLNANPAWAIPIAVAAIWWEDKHG